MFNSDPKWFEYQCIQEPTAATGQTGLSIIQRFKNDQVIGEAERSLEGMESSREYYSGAASSRQTQSSGESHRGPNPSGETSDCCGVRKHDFVALILCEHVGTVLEQIKLISVTPQ